MNKLNKRLNLLQFDYNEYLFKTINSYFIDKSNKSNNNIIKGRIHLLSHSIIFDPEIIDIPMIKLYFNQNFLLKKYNSEELASLIIEQKKNKINKKQKNSETKKYYSFITPHSKIKRKYSYNKNYYQKNYINNTISNLSPKIKKTNSKDKFNIFNFGNFEKMLQNTFNNSENEITQILNLNSKLIDLNNYFNPSIFSNLVKLFQYLNNINDNGNNYVCLLIKCDKIKKINRINFTEILNNESSIFFIITEDKKELSDNFYNDLSFFIENMCLSEDKIDDEKINNYLIRKLIELRNKYNIIKTDVIEKIPENNNSLNDYNICENNKEKKNILYSAIAMNINSEKYQNGLFIINLYDEIKNDYLCEFLPINNSLYLKPFKFYLNEIKYFIDYRFLYKYKAINIFFYSSESKIIEFDEKEDFTIIYNFFEKNCKKSNLNFKDIKFHTNLWVDGLISNFDYLMYLNIISSRSFNDLTQYPIFPWTLVNFEDKNIDLNKLSNYRDLSKPIGAINQEKLDYSIKTFEEKGYFYKNYISYPFIIYNYLIRKNPYFLLRNQKEKIFSSERLFLSIKETYENIINNKNYEVKELIPEFYYNGEFLNNTFNISLTQNNIKINNIELPPWANNSINSFIKIMRSALESEIVSNKLHLWIDLIFGYKQKGNKSIENYNLYSTLRYEKCIYDIDEKNSEEKNCDIQNIIEYGQCPIQLFNEAHPKKKSKFILNDLNNNFNDLCNNKIFNQITKQKQERIKIEDKYEKERREKDNKNDRMKNIFKEKEKNYLSQIKEEKDKINKKNNEFVASIISLMTINNKNKNNFNIYQNYKERIIQSHLEDIDEKKNEQIQNCFKDNKELFDKMNKISEKLSFYQKRDFEFKTIIFQLENKLNELKEENKNLQKEKFDKNRLINNLPFNIKNKI